MNIEELLAKTFGDDTDVMDVANYVLSTMKVNQAIIRGLATGEGEVTGVNPLELRTMRRYENGMVTNRFYHENFAIIKASVALYEMKVATAGVLVSYNHENKSNKYLYKHVQAVFLTALDIFTTIALLYKGVEFAERFDVQLRSSYELDPEFDKWLLEQER